MYKAVLFFHLLGAAIWVGGHLILTLSILSEALIRRDPEPVRRFERVYERIGMPALAVQVASGLWLATQWLPDPLDWLQPDDPAARTILLKLGCLAATAALAVHARLRIIPKLDAARLPGLGVHILGVTALSLAFVWLGLSFRTGGI